MSAQKQQALKQLEAGIPIDPALIVNGVVSLAEIIAQLFQKRAMLRQRVEQMAAILATQVQVNELQEAKIKELEFRLSQVGG
jgi:predicted nucleic acid-binding protein